MFRTVEAARGYLLLQIDPTALQQAQFAEGTICVVIHKEDLAARSFNQAQTIYQQT